MGEHASSRLKPWWQGHDIFGSCVLPTCIFKTHSPRTLPQPRPKKPQPTYLKPFLPRVQQDGNSFKPSCLETTASDQSSFPLHSPPSHRAGPETSLKFIALHDTPRSAGIHHRAFHGGEGREDVKSFAGEGSVAAATGPDGHGWWDLLVPLSWEMNQRKCYGQKNQWEEH